MPLCLRCRDGGDVSHVVFSNIAVSTRYTDSSWWGAAEPIYITAVPRTAGTKVRAARAGRQWEQQAGTICSAGRKLAGRNSNTRCMIARVLHHALPGWQGQRYCIPRHYDHRGERPVHPGAAKCRWQCIIHNMQLHTAGRGSRLSGRPHCTSNQTMGREPLWRAH